MERPLDGPAFDPQESIAMIPHSIPQPTMRHPGLAWCVDSMTGILLDGLVLMGKEEGE